MRKDVIKSLIAIKQSEIPFDVIEKTYTHLLWVYPETSPCMKLSHHPNHRMTYFSNAHHQTPAIERDIKLPINRNKIITVPGVRRCGKSTLMEIAINGLVREGVIYFLNYRKQTY